MKNYTILTPHPFPTSSSAFVYGDGIGEEDLARQATDTFAPLDGLFNDNVIIQVSERSERAFLKTRIRDTTKPTHSKIKNGPYDFQIREPLQPLIGALKNTNIMMEVQASQEYTGQQIHAVSLPQMWEHYLAFDTQWEKNGASTVAKLISGTVAGGTQAWGGGMACVSNVGNMGNWTGNIIAASNTYGFGKLAWNPVEAKSVNIIESWAARTFERDFNDSLIVQMVELVQSTWQIYEHYWGPLGVGFVIAQNNPFGCAPATNRSNGLGPGGEPCKPIPQKGGGRGAGNDHYW